MMLLSLGYSNYFRVVIFESLTYYGYYARTFSVCSCQVFYLDNVFNRD
jgi:hypothetical protein